MSVPTVLQVNRYVVEELVWESVNVFTLKLKPEQGTPLAFLAGQWVYLHLLNQDGSSWGRAAFSIASAPVESKETLQLAVKMEKDFTKKAGQLQPGDVVGIQGPFGVFVLPEKATKVVMFAGGIGIAPFRSIIREILGRQLPIEMVLFYSNRFIEESVFFEELDDFALQAPTFKSVCTLTGGDVSSEWNGETGRFDQLMFDKHCQDEEGTVYMMCGPEAFMEQVSAVLAAKGIEVKTRLKKELFG
ncbi:FAD-dependent oxidoreductase [Patescibacteria group bacterium]|nr:FAD-dependent oxidoreductase [Patescibacteria group bacterium]